MSAVAMIVRLPGLLRVARGGENLARNLQRAGVREAAALRAAVAGGIVLLKARAMRVMESSSMNTCWPASTSRLQRSIASCAMRTWLLRSLSLEAGHDLGLRHAAADFRHFLGPLVHQQDDELHLRVVRHDGLADVLEKRRLARAGGGDDQAALALADRRHQVHDARRVAVRHGFELDALFRVDARQLVEVGQGAR